MNDTTKDKGDIKLDCKTCNSSEGLLRTDIAFT